MKRCIALLMCCLSWLASAADPEVRVHSRLVPPTPIIVGATVSLEVDLLVDTWFTDAPVLPTLELPGAVVSPPGGEAQHLNQQEDGKAFFGLRYTYQITPIAAQHFAIPALAFRVQPGQASGPVTVRSQPLAFEAKALAGGSAQQRLVAQGVELTQDIQNSHTPLRAGDSVTRRLHIAAQGAQAMLIPPPALVEVKGLKRYVQTPSVKPLGDGRGGTFGGQREDTVTYVIGAAGEYQLPAIELHWWDAASGEPHTVSVPAVAVKASEGVYQAPFSISDDLRALGQHTRVGIAGHWPLLGLLLLLGGGLAWAARTWGPAGWEQLRRWRARRRQAWLDSPGYAWRLARRQSTANPPRLDALYLWVRRATGRRTLAPQDGQLTDAAENHLLAFFQACYGVQAADQQASLDRRQVLQQLRRATKDRRPVAHDRHGLKSLNP